MSVHFNSTMLDHFFTLSSDLLCVASFDGCFTMVNPAFQRLLGYTNDELRTTSFLEVIHPDDRDATHTALQGLSADTPSLVFENRCRGRDGAYKWLVWTAVPDLAERLIYAVARDVTAHKQIQAEQQEAQRRSTFLSEASTLLASSLDYETTLASVARLVVPQLADWCSVDILAEDGVLRSLVVVHVDPAKVAWAHELRRRYPPDPNAPSGAWQVVRTGRPEIYPDIPDELLVSAVPDPELLAIVRALGLRSSMCVPMLARERTLGAISFVAAESGRHYGADDLAMAEQLATRAAIAVDHARLYRDARTAEERIRLLNTELEQRVAERTAELQTVNRELEAFAYSVSHDLRAPLRSIAGFSQALLEDYADVLNTDGQEYLQMLIGASTDMGRLIDDLLHLSRVARAEMQYERVDLSRLARAIAEESARRAPRSDLTYSIAEGLAARGNERLLRDVLENLLGNAWKFTRATPSAHIEVGMTVLEGQQVYFVRDNGAGFDMAYVHKLFGAFQRLHSVQEFEGSGIGLATVQRIIHRHGGQVWAEGAVSQGATFYFTLDHAEVQS